MSDMTVGAEQQAPQLHDVKVVRKKTSHCARVVPVPPEEFGIARNARSIKDAGYCFHEVRRRESDLIAEGYDADQIKGLPSYTIIAGLEPNARDTVDESRSGHGDDGGINKANREIRVTEHYVRVNYKGDGKACLYRVTTAGQAGEILIRNGVPDIVQVDVPPFAAMTPFIVTHRFFGKSVADFVMDIMRIKTALMRGLLDNTYLALNPRNEVAEEGASENTLDDLLISRPGGIVRVKRSGTVTPLVHPDISAGIYPAIQYMDATREWRTGVTRQGSGLDANALQNQTATSANQLFTAAQARIKLIARIFAETGIRDLFSLLHGTIRKNGSVAQTVRLRNQWVQVDPRDWKTRNDMTVTVGLGSGGKEQQLVGAQLLIGAQEKAIAAGMVSPKNLYNSAKMLTKLLGHKDVDEFFTPPQPDDPEADKPIPPPANPDIEKAKLEYQLKEKDAQNRAAIEDKQAVADITTNDRKTSAEIARDDRKFQQESAQSEREHEMRMMEMRMKVLGTMVGHATKPQQASANGEQPQPEGGPNFDELLAKIAPIINPSAAAPAESKPKRRKITTPSGKVYQMTEE